MSPFQMPCLVVNEGGVNLPIWVTLSGSACAAIRFPPQAGDRPTPAPSHAGRRRVAGDLSRRRHCCLELAASSRAGSRFDKVTTMSCGIA